MNTTLAAGNVTAQDPLKVAPDAYRNAFVKMKPDDVRRFFERDLKQVMPGAKLKSLKLTPENLLDMSAPVHAVLEFSADGMTASGHDKAIVTVPRVRAVLGARHHVTPPPATALQPTYVLRAELTSSGGAGQPGCGQRGVSGQPA